MNADTRAGLNQKVWGVGVRGDTKSLPMNNSLIQAVRIAVGAVLFAAALMILGSTGAFATSAQDSTSGSGLLSGIVSPVENVVEKTVSPVPVVEAVPIVDPVVAPVSAADIPIVTAVIDPPAILPPVIGPVDAVTAPVLGTVKQITEPALEVVAPVVDPVVEVVNPIVDGDVGGVGSVVEHVVPELPEIPGAVPVIPTVVGEVPGVVTPGIPAVSEVALDTPNFPATPAPNASATSAVQPGPDTAAPSPAVVAHRIPADSLAAAELIPEGFWAVDVPALTGAGSPGSGTHSAACSSTAGQTVGPCAPAVASTVGSAPSGPGSGGSGGSSGAAANENFSISLNFEAGRTVISNTGWPLPASMPSDPGSSPD